jgi:peptide/nickel transport system permease protein
LLKYILKRLKDIIPTIFLVTLIVFVITRIIPGNPASAMLGPQASAEAIKAMEAQLGLDKPIMVQFVDYLKDLLRLDFGTSYTYNAPVFTLIAERFPNTVSLSLFALFIALILGVPMGIFAALKKDSVTDLLLSSISLLGVSIPVFWLGIMLALLFSVKLQLLPSNGMGSMENGFGSYLSYYILPGITLATIPMANFARITRSSILDVMNNNYIKTARAKGVSNFKIVTKHAFKNAAIPLITVIGMQLSSLLSGAVLTETIYSWPGMGRLIVEAIDKRDFVVVQGVVIFTAIIYVLVNLIVDILYKVVNPKVDIEGEK